MQNETENQPLSPLLESVRDISRSLASANASLEEQLHRCTALIAARMHIDLCVLLLLSERPGCYVIRASSLDLKHIQLGASISIESGIEKRLGEDEAIRERPLLAQVNPLQGNDDFDLQLALPLKPTNGGSSLGVLLCYGRRAAPPAEMHIASLQIMAAFVALVIENRHLLDLLGMRDQPKFLEELFTVTPASEDVLRQKAAYLGHDLTQPHLVVLMKLTVPARGRPADDLQVAYAREADRIRHILQEQWPGALLSAQQNFFRCLVAEEHIEHLVTRLRELCLQIREREEGNRLYVGVSNLCRTVSDYARGAAEALEALDIGTQLYPLGGCSLFRELGIYRYVNRLSRLETDPLDDPYQQVVKRIADYDREKQTDLLETLVTFFQHKGALRETGRALDIHHNTLKQRLDRIQQLAELENISFQSNEPLNWLSLEVAIMLYKRRSL